MKSERWNKCTNRMAVSVGAVVLLAGCATRLNESGEYTCFGEGAYPGSMLSRARNSVDDLAFYNFIAARPNRELEVEDVVHLALKHNIELWVSREQIDIQEEMRSRACFKMLPSLMLNANNTIRSRENVSSSSNYYTRQTSVPTTYSRERHQQNMGAEAAWGMLDFGLGYVKALQEQNQKQVVEHIYRRARQKLVQDVKAAYWTAVASDEVAKVANSIGVVIEKQREILERQVREGHLGKEEGLAEDLHLLERLKTMSIYDRDAKVARAELARLVGMPVGLDFKLAPFDFYNVSTAAKPVPEVEQARKFAVMNRPELYRKDLEEAISYEEARAALIKMLPSPSMFWRFDYDRDDHLLFDNWKTYGLRASWDLLSIPVSMKERKIGKLKAALTHRERMAMTVGVMTQVNISYLEYYEAKRAYGMSDEIHNKRMDLLSAVISGADKGTRTQSEVLDQKLLYLQDRAAYLMAFANVAAAKARIYSAMGIDPDEDGSYILEGRRTSEQVLESNNWTTISTQEFDQEDENSAEFVPPLLPKYN